MNSLIRKAKKLVQQGLLHIFSTSVINKIIGMLTNAIIVRIFTKEDYGYFSFAYNLITTIMIFSSLGTNVSILQYGCEIKDEKKRASVEKTLFLMGLGSNLVFSLATFLYAVFIPLSMPAAKNLLIILSFVPVFQFVYAILNTELRILGKNKEYAASTNVQTISYFAFACLGAFLFNTTGTSVGRYLGYFVPIVYLLFSLKDKLKLYATVPLETKMGQYIKYSFWVVLANVSSSVLYHLDVYLVGLITSDSNSIAEYKVATQIPNALVIIPTAFITFVYPKFVAHNNDAKWLKKNLLNMQLAVGGISFCVAALGFIFAPLVIKIVFGSNYNESVIIFRILMVSFFISSTFRVIYGNVLSMLHRVKANFWIGIIDCVINIVADYYLIKYYGGIGAAMATTLIICISSIISGFYLMYCIKKIGKNPPADLETANE